MGYEVQGKVGIYDDYREAISMVLLKNGITDLNTGSTSDLNTAKQDLLNMIDAVSVRTTTNGAYSGLPNGEFNLHQAWSGDIVSAWVYTPHVNLTRTRKPATGIQRMAAAPIGQRPCRGSGPAQTSRFSAISS